MAEISDPGGSRAVLIGVGKYSSLEQLPAVQRNLVGLRTALTDPAIWGLPGKNCTVQDQPGNADLVLDNLQRVAAAATDTLVVYFAGHGLVDPLNEDELYLALPDSDLKRAYRTALPYSWIRRELQPARARRKIVILDCCYSGRALGPWMGDGRLELADRLEIEGTCVLTATAGTRKALSLSGEHYTAFTGELISILTSGIPDGPELLDMDTIYRYLAIRLRSRDLPRPQRGQLDHGGNIVICRNQAHAIAPEPGHRPEGQVPAPAAEPKRIFRGLRRAAQPSARPVQPEVLVPPAGGGSTAPGSVTLRPDAAHPAAGPAAAAHVIPRSPASQPATASESLPPAMLSPNPPQRSSPPAPAPPADSIAPPRSAGLEQTEGLSDAEPLPSGDIGVPGSKRHAVSRRLRLLYASLAIGALATAFVVIIALANPPSNSASPNPASLPFPVLRYSDGLAITRSWTLSGRSGTLLTETLSASSTTGKSLDVSFTESIPPAIASDPGNLTFSLAPAKITPEKHLAEWTLQVPAHGVTLITFRVAVPPGGPAKARLRQWARDLAALPAAQSEPIPAVQVKTLEIKPKAIHISVGKTLRADLSGTLSDGKAAPEAELAGVTWETRDPSIATVSPSGVLTGRAAGQTTLLVRIGAAHLTVPVIVSKPAGPSPPAPTPTGTTPVPSPPPSSAPPSSTPTPNPTPTLTPKPL